MKSTRKRFKTLVCSFVALFFLILLELFLQKKQYLIGGGISRVFLFLLINLHIIAIVVLLYLIIRNTTKIFVEVSRKKPGSHFKKNLLASFTIFSVIPSLLVLIIAGKLITSSIDDWFSVRIKTAFKTSLALHEKHTQEERVALKRKVRDVLPLRDFDLAYKINFLCDVDDGIIHNLSDEAKTWRDLRKFNDRPIKSLKNRFLTCLEKAKDETVFDFYGSLYCVKKIGEKALLFVYRYPEHICYPLIDVQNALFDYNQLRSIKNPIYWNYIFTLLLLILLIFFLSIWCSFYLARGISRPIEELLQATSKIRKGDFDVQVGHYHSSDLKNLAIAFNEMTKALKHAHTQLEQKNKEMLMILQNIKEAVFFVNKFGRILTYNDVSKELVAKYLGLSRFKKQKVSFFGHDVTNTFFKLVRDLRESEKNSLTKELEFTFHTEPKTLMVHLTYVNNYFAKKTNLKKTEHGLLVIIEDLTDIVKINKMKTWQQAAKQMAHEIKNPLTPIQLATQRLQRKFRKQLDDDTVFLECTDTILNQVKIIKDLVSHFSEFATLPSSKIEPLDLNKVIRDVVCLYEHSYPEISFVYELEELIPLVKIDKKKIKRVLVNLLDNSIRALKHVSSQTNVQKLTVGIREKKSVTIKTSFKTGLNQIELLFSDNGPGIPIAVKDKLFMPYVSGEKKNMGLGLAIAYEIVKKVGGNIKLLPSQTGAMFQILLNI
jgi:two-component system nitrogen regulation sensor histidine kinase NtrY